MKDEIFLTFNANKIVSMRHSPPPLRAGEYAVKIKLTVEDKYFKRIIPIAYMELDGKQLIEPKIELEAEDIPEEEVEELEA